MSRGSYALSEVYAKLDWAAKHHDDMERVSPGLCEARRGDERPYGIRLRERNRPAGLSKRPQIARDLRGNGELRFREDFAAG